jgi:hypothetical protein
MMAGHGPNHGKFKNDPTRSKGPAKGVRPQFKEGNEYELVHGAKSPRHYLPKARELAEGLPEVAPWTARPAFAATVASWSKAEAQCQLLHAYLDSNGLLDGEGHPRPATSMLTACETRAGNLRQQLGLTPVALAKLLQSLASVAASAGDTTSLDAVRAEGERISLAYTQQHEVES